MSDKKTKIALKRYWTDVAEGKIKSDSKRKQSKSKEVLKKDGKK